MTRLKLAIFWIKHQDRTLCEIGVTAKPLLRVTFMKINALKVQKRLKDNWTSDNKEPAYVPITLDMTSAVKAFDRVKTILTHVWGVMGVPLAYVIRHLIIPYDEDEEIPLEDANSKFISHNQEMIVCTHILTDNANFDLSHDELEANGLFVLLFLTDLKMVWAILHALFSASIVWQHVKNFHAMQNGWYVWCTLHNHFLGDDKVNTTYTDILSTLKSLYYNGDRKNYNFDKYCTTHMEQHN